MERTSHTPINILGGSFFGNLLTTLGFGVLTIQVSSYYHSFPNDGRPLKLAAFYGENFTLIFQGIFLIFCCEGLPKLFKCWYLLFGALPLLPGNNVQTYQWPIPFVNYNSHLTLERATWEFIVYQITTACASVTVQTFFAHRVYSLSDNLYLGVLVQVLVLLQFGFAAVAIRAYASPYMVLDFRVIIKECTWLVEAWFIIQAIADVVIATYMCILLRRRRTGFPKTDSVINRMVLYTISTGLITSVLSCFLLGMVFKHGYHFSVVVIGLSLGAFYSVTMLTNLHLRTRLRARLDTPTPLELINSSIKKRIQQNVGDYRSVRLNAYIAAFGVGSHAARISITTEVVSSDVDIKPMVRTRCFPDEYSVLRLGFYVLKSQGPLAMDT
ncbi:hypothetical protein BS47DRAFT_1392639 [Hydnum rufescens UP504]|uniref:DUF6534 domain-containing protein n=1 Tax=Hydnum rufescens UP504 TaxID=1448309 RepID=A0A9P6DTE6_9AGAM|nr:hypothetical protein BS47DRAFT_1392639 [Hydnum rufescens UP504]